MKSTVILPLAILLTLAGVTAGRSQIASHFFWVASKTQASIQIPQPSALTLTAGSIADSAGSGATIATISSANVTMTNGGTFTVPPGTCTVVDSNTTGPGPGGTYVTSGGAGGCNVITAAAYSPTYDGTHGSITLTACQSGGCVSAAFTLTITGTITSIYEPPGCVPGNHGLVRGRPSIKTISGVPVLVTDDGCLLITVSMSNSDGGGAPANSWWSTAHSVGFNGGVPYYSSPVCDPNQGFGTNTNYSGVLSDMLNVWQAEANSAAQNGMYFVLLPTYCGNWGGASWDQSWDNTAYTAIANQFKNQTNVIITGWAEDDGFLTSCPEQGSVGDYDYGVVRAAAPNTMMINVDGKFAGAGCGGSSALYADTLGAMTNVNYNNAVALSCDCFDSSLSDTSAYQTWITTANSYGSTVWDYEGPSPNQGTSCDDASGSANIMKFLASHYVGFNCIDDYPPFNGETYD